MVNLEYTMGKSSHSRRALQTSWINWNFSGDMAFGVWTPSATKLRCIWNSLGVFTIYKMKDTHLGECLHTIVKISCTFFSKLTWKISYSALYLLDSILPIQLLNLDKKNQLFASYHGCSKSGKAGNPGRVRE